MLAHRLKPLSALGRPFLASDNLGPVTIAESMDTALASLAARRGREAELRARAAEAGLPLPGPGQAAAQGIWGAFWVSPEMWLLEAPFASHEDIVAQLKPLLGDAASLTEQTDAWVRFEVTGPLQPLFERLCNLDLARFAPGSATRTMMEHLSVYAIRRAPDAMTLLGPRSSAGSLHHALLAAARSAF
jgi:sarcosine oxidase subunit gamma